MTEPASAGFDPPAQVASDAPPATSRPVWVVGFLLFFGLLAAWSLATPIYAAPDEPAHAYRAASLVRGELLGVDVSKPGDPSVLVRVPSALTSYRQSCFAFKPYQPASCMRTDLPPPGLVSVTTYTGRYPPLYAAIVGLPSLLPLRGSMVLWMRLVGDLLNALFLTVAFVMVTRRRESWWAIVGAAAAMTPLVLFIGSVVNPSGLEIASAMALWCTLLHWATAGRAVPATSTVIWAAVSAVVLESTRGLSPAFLLFTVGACALVAGWPRMRVAARRHDVRVAGGVVAGFGALAVAWVLAAGSLRLMGTSHIPPSTRTSTIFREVVHRAAQLTGFVGRYGWLDTAPPPWVVDVWRIVVVVLVAGVLLSRAWRSLAVLALIVLATIFVPAVGDLLQARTIGVISQPRYIMPVAVGAVLLAGSVIRWRGPWSAAVAQLMLAGIAVAQIGVFLRTLQRYRTGIGPKARPGMPVWSPPFGATAVTALFVVAWLWRLGQSTDRTAAVGRVSLSDQDRSPVS